MPKITLAAITAAILSGFDAYAPALLLLVGSVTGDYITGVLKGYLAHDLSSVKGLEGIIRKMGYFFGVAAAFGVDVLLSICAANLGLTVDLPAYFGLLVTLLLSINELISILENLAECGVPLPASLLRTLRSLKGKLDAEEETQDD